MVSIVIPCYQSAFTISPVVNGIHETMKKATERFDYEIILVNDGSPDNTFEVISGLAMENEHVQAVDLTRNYGQHSALMAAYSLVSGDYILGIDDDGEHDPTQMFKLIDELEKGYDYVCAKFPATDRSLYKKLGSKLNNWMATKYIGKPKDASFSSYYVMRRFVVDEIVKTRNPHPYIGGMIVAVTRKLSIVPMEQGERIAGTSGYNLKNSMSLWLNGITAYSIKPLRSAAYLGIITAIIGFVAGIIIVLRKLIDPTIAAGYTSLIAILLLIGGIQMIIMGMMGEYISRIYLLANAIPQFSIRTIVKQHSNQSEIETNSCL